MIQVDILAFEEQGGQDMGLRRKAKRGGHARERYFDEIAHDGMIAAYLFL